MTTSKIAVRGGEGKLDKICIPSAFRACGADISNAFQQRGNGFGGQPSCMQNNLLGAILAVFQLVHHKHSLLNVCKRTGWLRENIYSKTAGKYRWKTVSKVRWGKKRIGCFLSRLAELEGAQSHFVRSHC